MNDSSEFIKVCHGHAEYMTRLISTMAFLKAELWCPYCGANYGCLDYKTLKIDTLSPEALHVLDVRLWIYERIYKDYLMSCAATYADKINYRDQVVDPKTLPGADQARLANLRKSWRKNVEAESRLNLEFAYKLISEHLQNLVKSEREFESDTGIILNDPVGDEVIKSEVILNILLEAAPL